MNCYRGTRKSARYTNSRNKKKPKKKTSPKKHVQIVGWRTLLWLLVLFVERKVVRNALRIIRKTANIIVMTAGKERR